MDKEKTFQNLAKCGKVWEGFGKKRVYLSVPSLLELSNNQARKYMYAKFYFDEKEGFGSNCLTDQEFEKCKEVVSWAIAD